MRHHPAIARVAQALPTQRKVILRTSFVIGRDRGAGGGALARLRRLVRLGLGGRVGSGRQGMSWIHEVDMNRLFERALTEIVCSQGARRRSEVSRWRKWASKWA